MANRKTASKSAKAGAAKRERVDTGTDKRLVRRKSSGQFKESDDLGKALAADGRTKAKRAVKSGHGDKGDRKRR